MKILEIDKYHAYYGRFTTFTSISTNTRYIVLYKYIILL